MQSPRFNRERPVVLVVRVIIRAALLVAIIALLIGYLAYRISSLIIRGLFRLFPV